MFLSCNDGKNKRPSLPRLIPKNERSCEKIEADTFSNLNDLLQDFYTTSFYKDSFELNLRFGAYYYYHQAYDSSLYYYLKAKQIDSADSKLHFNISLTLTELKKFDEALNSINKAIDICGPNWFLLNSKCYILWKLNKPQEGIEVGLVSLKLNPDNKKIYGNLLHCFDAIGEKDSVLKYIDIIEKKRTTLPEWYKELKVKYGK